ncbi:potassium channel subfamily T member 2-like protein, partial [Dinothrombium tinctorium]
DEHTILRSWAIRDFAPNVPQYVQIFRPENKVHVAFAEHVVCEDEFKYALLANNCLCPGASTLVTLLLHTSRGQYGVALIGVQTDMRGTWPIMLNPGPSYILKSTDICFYMNITKEENSAFLPATSQNEESEKSDKSKIDLVLKLESGADKLENGEAKVVSNSTLISETRRSSAASNTEESIKDQSPIKFRKAVVKIASKTKHKLTKRGSHLDIPDPEYGSRDVSPNNVMSARGRRPSIAPVPTMLREDTQESDSEDKDANNLLEVPCTSPSEYLEIVKGFPPVSPFIGVSPTLCYLFKEKKPSCCLQLSKSCEHCEHQSARDYNWSTPCIILAADFASNGIYNFIVPLRAHFHSPQSLRPIVLLLEKRPHQAFIDAISWFPFVYWMQGSIDYLDDLLHAGINLAESVVVVNKESTNSAEEDYLADCNTIVAVQTMFKMFPSVRIITELSQSSNMRFMQFRAHDVYALSLSKVEKHEKESGSHISYMFRLPFAAGCVFSASMLDTLLYQAFVKDYMITVIRLLLGIDQAPGSGFLSSIKISKDDLWIRTYGRLYQKLCSTTCEIPVGIYRTKGSNTKDLQEINLAFSLPISERMQYQQLSAEIERQEISNLVRNRMQDLGLPIEDYDDVSEKRHSLSFVIINPSCDLKLEEGDIIYLIRPSPIKSKKTFLTRGNSIRNKVSIRRANRRKVPSTSPQASLTSLTPLPTPSPTPSPSISNDQKVVLNFNYSGEKEPNDQIIKAKICSNV